MSVDVALAVLQLVALTIPPIAVLVQMLRRSENLKWKWRKLSFGLAIASVLSFIGTGAAAVVYVGTTLELDFVLQLALWLAVVGLVPFAVFVGVLYREHRAAFGP